MPIYEYKCDNGHVFDVIQKMSDDPLTECQECGAPAARVLHPVAVHFKGSGFYNTDYGRGKAGANGGSGGEDSGASPGASESKPSEPKSSDSSGKSPGSKAKAASTAD